MPNPSEEQRKLDEGPNPGTCAQCGGLSQRVARFDTFGCPSCLVWTEERHTPDNCPDYPFEYPPERPTAEMFVK